MRRAARSSPALISSMCVTLVIVILSSCALPSPEYDESPASIDAAVVRGKLASIRGMNFTRDVEVFFEKQAAISNRMQEEIVERYGGPAKLDDLSSAYAKLGLLPASVDLKTSLLEYLGRNVSGFYSMITKKIVIAQPKGILYARALHDPADNLAESVLAHEFTHALQDQNFFLGERLLRAGNSDAAMAFRAITEGDAILAEMAYESGGIDGQFSIRMQQALAQIVSAPEPLAASMPALVRDRVRFPYEAGAAFVHRVFRKHGWTGVNRLYERPPLSTEQVLHPEKYFDRPDPPSEIRLAGLREVFSSDWRPLENSVLGELLVRCLFKQFLPLQEAIQAASGWDGDRFAAFKRGRRDVAFVWLTAWDTEADAEEFLLSYKSVLTLKHANAPMAQRAGFAEQRKRFVMVVEGIDMASLHFVLERIWKQSASTKPDRDSINAS